MMEAGLCVLHPMKHAAARVEVLGDGMGMGSVVECMLRVLQGLHSVDCKAGGNDSVA